MTWTEIWAARKEILYGLTIAGFVWYGWWFRAIYDDHKDLAKLQASERQVHDLQVSINSRSAEYETNRAKYAAELETTKKQLRVYHAKHDNRVTCPVTGDLVQILNRK